MIPLKDDIPSERFPIINILLIITNILIFLFEISLGREELQLFIQQYGVKPYSFFEEVEFSVSPYLTLFTAQFLHGGWVHLIGNMLFLFIFGDNVEDRMGHLPYIVFYLTCGVIANVSQVLISPHSIIPCVGASGAIAGVLGAYIILFPRGRIMTLLPIGIFLHIVYLPALVFLGIWFIFQFLSGGAQVAARETATGGVAYFAHVGGFIAGLILVSVFTKKSGKRYYYG